MIKYEGGVVKSILGFFLVFALDFEAMGLCIDRMYYPAGTGSCLHTVC